MHTCAHISGVSTHAHTRTCTPMHAHARTSMLHTRIRMHAHAQARAKNTHTHACISTHTCTHNNTQGAGQGRAGQGRAGQAKASQGKPRRDTPAKPNQTMGIRESRNRATTRPHQSYAVLQRAAGDTNNPCIIVCISESFPAAPERLQ